MIKKIRSEVIRIKSAKMFLKCVIKGVIKGCKNLVFLTKYKIKIFIFKKAQYIDETHDIECTCTLQSNYFNVHLIYATKGSLSHCSPNLLKVNLHPLYWD